MNKLIILNDNIFFSYKKLLIVLNYNCIKNKNKIKNNKYQK